MIINIIFSFLVGVVVVGLVLSMSSFMLAPAIREDRKLRGSRPRGDDPFPDPLDDDPLLEEFRALELEVRQRDCPHRTAVDVTVHDGPITHSCRDCGLTLPVPPKVVERIRWYRAKHQTFFRIPRDSEPWAG